jgi:hypothetical protein
MRGKIENTTGCAHCRESWYGYDPIPKIGVKHQEGIFLHRCPRCATCWVSGELYTEIVLEEGELQGFSEYKE